MRENMVRISFDVPEDEHLQLKLECVQARMKMKDFLHNVVMMGMQVFKNQQLQAKLKKSVQQVKEGKVVRKTLGDLEKFVEDDE